MRTVLVIGSGASSVVAALEVQRQGGKAVILHPPGDDGVRVKIPGVGEIGDATVRSLSGRPGNFVAHLQAGGREVSLECGAVILAIDGSSRPMASTTRVMSLSAVLGGIPAAVGSAAMVLNAARPSRSSHIDAVKLAADLKRSLPCREVYIIAKEVMTMGSDEIHYLDAQLAGVIFIRTEGAPDIDAEEMTVHAVDSASGAELEVRPDLIVLEDEQEVDAAPSGRGLLVPPVDGGRLRQGNVGMGAASTIRGGVFLCGTAGRPLLVDELIISARAAATRAVTVAAPPPEAGKAAKVDAEKCSACLTCVRTCPYSAPRMSGEFKAVVLEDLCRSCGACVSMCPSRAITLEGADRADLDRMLSGALGEGTG